MSGAMFDPVPDVPLFDTDAPAHAPADACDAVPGSDAAAGTSRPGAERLAVTRQWLTHVCTAYATARAAWAGVDAHIAAQVEAVTAERDEAIRALAATMADGLSIHPDVPHDIPADYAQHPAVVDLAESLKRARADRDEATKALAFERGQVAMVKGHLNEVYTERNTWAALAVSVLDGEVCEQADPAFPAWPVVYAQTPAGQVSAHISPEDASILAGLRRSASNPWDGHDKDENTARLRSAVRWYAGRAHLARQAAATGTPPDPDIR